MVKALREDVEEMRAFAQVHEAGCRRTGKYDAAGLWKAKKEALDEVLEAFDSRMKRGHPRQTVEDGLQTVLVKGQDEIWQTPSSTSNIP